MNIVFKRDLDLRKLVAIHQMFGPPDSPARRMQAYAPLVSREFWAASQISNFLKFRTKKECKEFYLAMMESGEEKRRLKLKRMKMTQASELLKEVSLPPMNESYFKVIEDGLIDVAKRKGKAANA